MKICIVTPKVSRNDGQGRVNYELALYLATAGHQVSLLAMKIDSALGKASNLSCQELSPPAWIPTALLRNQWFALRSRQWIRRRAQDFDIIHLNGSLSYYPADINASHFVHANWLKSVYHPSKSFGGIYAGYQWLYTKLNAVWEQKAYHSAAIVVAVSDFVRDSLIQDVNLPPSQVKTILNGVDIQEFAPLKSGDDNFLSKELSVPEDSFFIFFSGGIRTNRKNLDLVIKALTHLDSSFHLVVAGSNSGSPYPAMARELNVSKQVHFLGHRTDISTLLRCANAFAFPSHYDPYPLSVLEALASGVPVITAPSVGSSALIQSGVNGFLLKHSNDLEGMVASLSYLAKEPESAAQIARAGRQTAEDLSWEKMGKRYENLYHEVYLKKQNYLLSGAVTNSP
ncbi:glycosyltransferase family 4 protein [Leptolyngbya sp. KIOST-1]|uniref:glycosyltransferase family 4 protein n=1 Tax=Leptolyngbya sp. KIOST-1 TaxID=1229172 RepID=UPI000907B717|nr:glycosyltransferase family 4 protein [Leptolyngbya sp. KIOST-1]